MKSEFYISTEIFGEIEIKKEKGIVTTVKTIEGPLEIGFRYVYRGNYPDDILCVGTELDTGIVIGKSDNVVNCAKIIKENVKKPEFRSRMKSPIANKLRKLIREEKEKVANE